MSATLVSYVAHYLVARLVYDDLVRPITHGRAELALLIAAIAGTAYALGRRSGRRA